MSTTRKVAATIVLVALGATLFGLGHSVRTLTRRLDAMQRGTVTTAWRAEILSEDLSDVRRRVAHLEDENWTNVDGAVTKR